MSVLVNLALVFAVGIPIGLATRDKGYAALIGLVTFVVFINAMNVTLQLQGALTPAAQMKAAGQTMVLGVQVLEMGVFAGILTGALSGYLYNKYSGVHSLTARWRFTPATVLSPSSCSPSPCCSAW